MRGGKGGSIGEGECFRWVSREVHRLTLSSSDQLWTNDGMFRPAPPGEQYPPDLDDYPEHGEGWMNEDGVRIDMEHRRVPKIPKRSALKQATFPVTPGTRN